MQVKSIAECSKGSILQYFWLTKLPFVIKIFALSIFEWLLNTGFTVVHCGQKHKFLKEFSTAQLWNGRMSTWKNQICTSFMQDEG